jgi:hypothetical protein
MTKLYLIHPEFDFNKINKKSILLTKTNTNIVDAEYHTSLGDLSTNELLKIINKFDSIEFVNKGFENDFLLRKETEQFVHFLSTIKPVTGLMSDKPLSFTDHTEINLESSDPVLWVFGCSHSHGVGLTDEQDPYGRILANELSLELRLITKPGSSLHWSLRHLINSAIKKSDIVIWQLTSPLRLSYFNGKHVEEIALSQSKNRHLLEVYNDFQCYFMHFSLINIGVQHLKQTGAKVILTSVDASDYQLQSEYSKYNEYYFANGFGVDLGTDNMHFGPLSHKNLASSLLNRIQLKNV